MSILVDGGVFLVDCGSRLIRVALTIYVSWRRRYFEKGFKKGTAKTPARVRRENPPDPGT